MIPILAKTFLAPNIYEFVVGAPRIARKARPGQFVVAMSDETGERIPLTIADYSAADGTITLVVMIVGASTAKLCRLHEGEHLYALIGPLGEPSRIDYLGAVVMVAGGVGAAPIYPIARAFCESGGHVITVQGARSKDLVFWQDRLAAVSSRHILTTDDGTAGRRGLVTEPLREILEEDSQRAIGAVYAIGPPAMMKCCSKTTQPFGVKTIVSLNSVMVDGTGMCGGCRVEIGRETKFTCVDGPEFDGHLVDWDLFLARQKTYVHHEQCALEQSAAQAKS
ncbi:MAG: sulfide/dihydroorotate dehydrogenase-like FAD/NAD-binding protein [Pirellulales bacterium]|nr:sulfide/dihydroorotate dehydrogenase-like FAD/NAD-binding protein [Pirellulales bacterium]